MALTQISTGGVKNDAVTAGKIPADAVGQSEIADEAVDEARLQGSNAGTNGQFLQKSSNTGGLTWATVDTNLSSDTTPQLGGDVDTNDHNIEFKDRNGTDDANVLNFGAGDDMRLYSDGTNGYLQADTELRIGTASNTTNAVFTPTKFDFRQDVDITNSKKLGIGGSYGSSGQVLTSGGSGAAPSWTTISAAPEVTGTASGAIAADKAVMVKSDGNFEQVTGNAAAAGSISSSPDDTNVSIRAAWNSNDNRIIIVYPDDNNSNYPTSCVGSIANDGAITWGTPTVITSNAANADGATISWSSTSQKALFAMKNGSPNCVKYLIGTMSGDKNSITWSGEHNNTAMDSCEHMEQVWNPDDDKHFVLYRDNGDGSNFKCREVTISGGSVSEGNVHELKNENHYQMDVCYDTVRNRYVCAAARLSDSGHGYVYTVRPGSEHGSGNCANTGNTNGKEFRAGGAYDARIVYDTNANKSVVFWKDSIDSDGLYAITVTLANDDAQTHGTITRIIDANFSTKSWSVVYDPNVKKIIVTYASTQTGTAWKALPITVNSDGTLTTGTVFTMQSTFAGTKGWSVFDANTNKVISVSNKTNDSSNDIFGIAFAASSTNLEAARYIGFSAGTYSNGNTATVKVASNTSTQSSMTPATTQYVQVDGTVGGTAANPSVVAGTALSATKLLIK